MINKDADTERIYKSLENKHLKKKLFGITPYNLCFNQTFELQ